MKSFSFAIIASGLNPDAPDFANRLFEAGCDDATVSFQKGVILLEFEREARSFTHALVSAIADVVRAGAQVEHIEPDYLVSLSDIAGRTGLSRAAVSLYAKGKRGENFPAPVARITTESPLWDWFEVARWMFRKNTIPRHVVIEARVLRAANRALHATEFEVERTIVARTIRDLARREPRAA